MATRVRLARVALLSGALALAACSEDAPPDSRDAAASLDGGAGGSVAEQPDIPWLAEGAPPVAPPVLLPCAPGWREIADDPDVPVCDPYPAGGPATCADGEAHFPGEPGCTRIGSACPADGLPADLPTDRPVVYLLAGSTGGDGSRASPYGAFAEFGLGSRPSGTIIALGRGTYPEVSLPGGITLHGACVSETILTTASPGEFEGVVTILGADTGVRNLRIQDSPRPGLVVGQAGASVHVEDVVVDGTEFVGLYAHRGGELTARSVRVQNTRGRPSDGFFGRGLHADAGGSAEVARAVFYRNTEGGVSADSEGSRLLVEDTLVHDTQHRLTDFWFGRGFVIQAGATAEARRVLLLENRDSAILASSDAMLRTEDLVIRGTRSRELDGEDGGGIAVQRSSTVESVRTLIEGNRGEGMFANEGATLRIHHAVVRDSLGQRSDGMFGRGVAAQQGSVAELRNALLLRNRDVGAYASGEGSTMSLEDVVIRDTESREGDLKGGRGLSVQWGAAATATRVIIERSRELGIFTAGDAASLTLTDALIAETRSQEADGLFGRGIGVQHTGVLHAVRTVFRDNRDAGIFGGLIGSSVRLEDVIVSGTAPETASGELGRGINLQMDAVLTGERVLVEGSEGIGVLSTLGAHMSLVDVEVRDTPSPGCGAPSCPVQPLGVGVGSYATATTSLERFLVSASEVCGVQLADDGELDLRSGEVSQSAIGACVQVDGYPLDRLSVEVLYRDNGVNLQATTLPVPDPLTPTADGT